MAIIRLNLEDLSRLEKVAQGEKIVPLMTGNAAFPDAGDLVTDLATKTAALKAKNLAQETAQQAAKEATNEANLAEAEYDVAATALGNHAQSESKGDETDLLSGGFDLRDERTPQIMGQVQNLSATAGDNPTEADLAWDPEEGAKSYEVQSSPDPVTESSWSHLDVVVKSKATFGGLPSGTICFFRVRAIGPNGKGPWSDPAMKRIP